MSCSRANASARSAEREATAANSPWPEPSRAPVMFAVESSPQRRLMRASRRADAGPRAESGQRAGPRPSRSSRLGASAPRERVDRHRGQEDQAGDDEPCAGAEAEQPQPIRDRGENQRAEPARLQVPAPAEQGVTADDGGRYRV